MYPTHNTLNETIRQKSSEVLNKHLAAAIDLHAQMKQAHWNVRGTGFIAVHELFDKVAEEVGNYSDMLAERARAIGATAHGTVQVAAEQSYMVPYKLGVADTHEHIFAVSAALAAFGQAVRDDISILDKAKDPDGADLLTQISRGIDQQLYFVESHLPVNVNAPQK